MLLVNWCFITCFIFLIRTDGALLLFPLLLLLGDELILPAHIMLKHFVEILAELGHLDLVLPLIISQSRAFAPINFLDFCSVTIACNMH